MNFGQQLLDAKKKEEYWLSKAETLANTNAPQKQFDQAISQVDHYKRQQESIRQQINAKNMSINTFDMSRFLNKAIKGEKVDGIEGLVNDQAVASIKTAGRNAGYALPMSLFNANTTANSGSIVADTWASFHGASYAYFGLADLGAMIFTDLQGINPSFAGTTTLIDPTDRTETGAAQEYTADIQAYTFSPKRLAISSVFSSQLLHSSNRDILNVFNQELVKPIMERAQKHALKNIIDNATNVVSIGTDGGALTYSKLIELKRTLSQAKVNRADMAIATSPEVEASANEIPVATGSDRFLWNPASERLMGLPTLSTTSVPSNLTKGSGTDLSAIILGDFSGLHIGFWGGFEILIDRYTSGTEGKVEITLDLSYDTQVVKPDRFAVIKDIVV